MNAMVRSLAISYVALLVLGRSALPWNAQWGDLLLPVLAWGVWRGRPLRQWARRDDWPLLLYLTVTLLAALASAEPRTGLAQLAKQLSVALILLVFRQLGGDPALSRTLARTFVLSVAAIVLVSIPIVFLGPPPLLASLRLGGSEALPFLGNVRRLRGAYLTPEMLGNALLVAFVLALALRAAGQNGSRRIWTAIAAVLLAAEVLTFSHSAAGFTVAAAIFGSSVFSSRALRTALWSLAISVVLLVNAASLVEPGRPANEYGVGRVSFGFMGAQAEGELNHYAALKHVAWSAFIEHPVAGVGPGQFATQTERAFREGRFRARYRHKPAQCDLLGRLAETGFMGGLSLLVLWVSWLRIGLSLPKEGILRQAAFAAVAGLLVNSVNADVMNFRFLWLALALMSAPTKGEDPAGS